MSAAKTGSHRIQDLFFPRLSSQGYLSLLLLPPQKAPPGNPRFARARRMLILNRESALPFHWRLWLELITESTSQLWSENHALGAIRFAGQDCNGPAAVLGGKS